MVNSLYQVTWMRIIFPPGDRVSCKGGGSTMGTWTCPHRAWALLVVVVVRSGEEG